MFEGCKTMEELKAEYRKAVKTYHPDLGGTDEDMKRVNLAFEERFNRIKAGFDDDDNETPEGMASIVMDLSGIDGIDVEIVGSWVWVSGDTFSAREQLKAMGCTYSGKRKMWYWHPGKRRYSSSRESMDSIRAKYGSRKVAKHDRIRLE